MSKSIVPVSVVITVRNGEKTIEDAVVSILGQTMTQWELIIVDDGSDDETLIKLAAFSDGRIRLLRTGGIGRANSLRLGVKVAKGEFIAILDADDVSHPERLWIQKNILASNPELSVLGSRQVNFSKKFPKWWNVSRDNVHIRLVGRHILFRNPLCHSGVMMRTRDLKAIGGYNAKRVSQIDYDLWLRFWVENHKIAISEQYLGGKRIHSGQSFENKKRIKYLSRRFLLQLKYWKLCNGSIREGILILGGFFYGFLPQKLRVRTL